MKNEIFKAYIDLLRVKDATHKLSCRHAQNSRVGWDYFMDCIILKKMPGHRLKILVFGDRYWNHNIDKKYIRYVDGSRVKPNSDFRSRND